MRKTCELVFFSPLPCVWSNCTQETIHPLPTSSEISSSVFPFCSSSSLFLVDTFSSCSCVSWKPDTPFLASRFAYKGTIQSTTVSRDFILNNRLSALVNSERSWQQWNEIIHPFQKIRPLLKVKFAVKRSNYYHLLLECVVLRFKDFFCPGKNTILCTKLCQLKIKKTNRTLKICAKENIPVQNASC